MTAEDLVVNVDRVLPAAPATVFRALTEPELFARWMGPQGSTVTVTEMEVVIGGRLAFDVRLAPDGPTFSLHGYYEDIDPGRRLVHSWMLAGDDEVSTVVFDLEPVGEQTRLTVTHRGLTSPEDVTQNDAGWSHQLERLEALLAAATPAG